MSRVAKKPIFLPAGVDFIVTDESLLVVKGNKGSMQMKLHDSVQLEKHQNTVTVVLKTTLSGSTDAFAGTMRALIQNMVTGVSQGFEKKLVLFGVGYRAQAQGDRVHLNLGFSHPKIYQMPKGISVTVPIQTEILISGIDKQLVGQVAANIRAFRSPEPYKGKGVRYSDEIPKLKEGKKK
jgi:large subunit ribosomal protein L6